MLLKLLVADRGSDTVESSVDTISDLPGIRSFSPGARQSIHVATPKARLSWPFRAFTRR